jgi:hypothetical protein
MLPNATFLRGLGFRHKASVWAAAFPGTTDATKKLIAPILRLNDLRNCVAHGDSEKQVNAALEALLNALPASNSDTDQTKLEFAVGYITGLLMVGRGRSQAVADTSA